MIYGPSILGGLFFAYLVSIVVHACSGPFVVFVRTDIVFANAKVFGCSCNVGAKFRVFGFIQ